MTLNGPINFDFYSDKIQKLKKNQKLMIPQSNQSKQKIDEIRYEQSNIPQYQIIPLYAHVSNHFIQSKDQAIVQLTNELNIHRPNLYLETLDILLQKNPNAINIIIEFYHKHTRQINHELDLQSHFEDEISYKMLDLVGINVSSKDDEKEQDIQTTDIDVVIKRVRMNHPTISMSNLKLANKVFDALYYAQTTTQLGLKSKDHKLKENIEKNIPNQAQLLSQFTSVLAQVVPSLSNIYSKMQIVTNTRNNDVAELKKKTKKLKAMGLDDTDLYEATQAIYENDAIYNGSDMCLKIHPYALAKYQGIDLKYKKQELKQLHNATISIRENTDTIAQYLILLHFIAEISPASRVSIVITFNINEKDYVINRINMELAAISQDESTPEPNMIPAKLSNRIIPIDERFHSISAFDLNTLTSKNPLLVESLINIFFSDGLTLSCQPITDLLAKATIPMNMLELALSDKSTFTHQINTVTDALSEIKDKDELFLIFKEAIARIYIGQAALVESIRVKNEHIAKIIDEKTESIEKIKTLSSESNKNVEEIKQKDKQIEELTRQLNQKESQLHDVKSQYDRLSKDLAPFDRLKNAHDELSSQNEILLDQLNHIQKSQHDKQSNDTSIEPYDESKVIDILNDHAVCVIGGHSHWLADMQRILPKAKMYDPDKKNATMEAIETADILIINTSILNHTLYRRVQAAIAENPTVEIAYINTQGSNVSRALMSVNDQLELLSNANTKNNNNQIISR